MTTIVPLRAASKRTGNIQSTIVQCWQCANHQFHKRYTPGEHSIQVRMCRLHASCRRNNAVPGTSFLDRCFHNGLLGRVFIHESVVLIFVGMNQNPIHFYFKVACGEHKFAEILVQIIKGKLPVVPLSLRDLICAVGAQPTIIALEAAQCDTWDPVLGDSPRSYIPLKWGA